MTMMLSTKERMAATKEKHAEMLAAYKAKLAAEKAEYYKKLREDEKARTGTKRDRDSLMIFGFSSLLKDALADETGKLSAMYGKMFKAKADASEKPRIKVKLEEIARMFEK
jgi:hypothetical protein